MRLLENALTFLASLSLSDYRNSTKRDSRNRTENVLAQFRTGKPPSFGDKVNILKTSSQGTSDHILGRLTEEKSCNLEAVASFNLVFKAVEQAVRDESNNLVSVIERHRKDRTLNQVDYLASWDLFSTYRNRAKGHDFDHNWPTGNDDYYPLVTQALEDAVLDTLLCKPALDALGSVAIGEVEELKIDSGVTTYVVRIEREGVSERISVPHRSTWSANRAATEFEGHKQSIILRKAASENSSAAYEIIGPFASLEDGIAKLLGDPRPPETCPSKGVASPLSITPPLVAPSSSAPRDDAPGLPHIGSCGYGLFLIDRSLHVASPTPRGIDLATFDEDSSVSLPKSTGAGFALTRDGLTAVHLQGSAIHVTADVTQTNRAKTRDVTVPDGYQLLSVIRYGRQKLRCLVTNDRSTQLWELRSGTDELKPSTILDAGATSGVFIGHATAWLAIEGIAVSVDTRSGTTTSVEGEPSLPDAPSVQVLSMDAALLHKSNFVAILTAEGERRRLRVVETTGTWTFSTDVPNSSFRAVLARDVHRNHRELFALVEQAASGFSVHRLATP